MTTIEPDHEDAVTHAKNLIAYGVDPDVAIVMAAHSAGASPELVAYALRALENRHDTYRTPIYVPPSKYGNMNVCEAIKSERRIMFCRRIIASLIMIASAAFVIGYAIYSVVKNAPGI